MDPDIIPLTEEDLHDLYLWVDEIPLSRPKRNIARDFSDGVCVAEMVKHYFPKLVELHNYQGAHSIQGKVANWETLNTRVFRKLFFEVPSEEIRDITAAVPGAVERFLRALRIKIEQIQLRQQQRAGGGAAASPQQQPRPMSSTSGRPMSSARGPSPQQQSRGGGGGASPAHGQGGGSHHQLQQEVYELRDILREKDHTIQQLQEAVALLTEKTAQLEELVNVKDGEVRMLLKQQQGGGGGGHHHGHDDGRSHQQYRPSSSAAGGARAPSSSGNGWRR